MLQISIFIHMLHTFSNSWFFCLCSVTIKLTDYQQVYMQKCFYCNFDDTFLEIPKYLRDKLVECQKLIFVDQAKRLLNITWWLFLVENSKIWNIYKSFTIIYVNLFWFKFSTNHTGQVHEYQICLSGRIDYSLYHIQNLKVYVQKI